VTIDTRRTLIDSATGLVRKLGYSGFSYADLADAVGIRKASIHHHFPTKEDLAVALVEAYTDHFRDRLSNIDARLSDPLRRIEAYGGLYREGLAAGRGCLCGVLASELSSLPEQVRAGVRQFFSLNLHWLERILKEGGGSRLRPDVQPRRDARTVLSTLQGAMLLSLSLGDEVTFNQALEGLLASLGKARS
jgi:TetR/AcrR family transcriptional repressor of nem operon